MIVPHDPEPLLGVLVDHGVDLIVVGGYAVAAHGHVRATKDIDICPDPAEENLKRLAAALAALEAKSIGSDEFDVGEFDLLPDLEGLRAGGNWSLTTKFGRLDLKQHLAGLGDEGGGWAVLVKHAITRSVLGHECLFCSYEDLIKMKLGADRPQDKVDVASLKAARGEA